MAAPVADVLLFPRVLWRSTREHLAGGAPLADFRLLSSWKRGRAGAPASVLVSYTEFRPHRRRDVPGIWLAAEELATQLVGLEGAYGVLTYLQLRSGLVGSLSFWGEEAGLRRFVSLPQHLEVVRRYRNRGLPLRSAKWWTEEPRIGPALAEGQKRLEGSADQAGERARRRPAGTARRRSSRS